MATKAREQLTLQLDLTLLWMLRVKNLAFTILEKNLSYSDHERMTDQSEKEIHSPVLLRYLRPAVIARCHYQVYDSIHDAATDQGPTSGISQIFTLLCPMRPLPQISRHKFNKLSILQCNTRETCRGLRSHGYGRNSKVSNLCEELIIFVNHSALNPQASFLHPLETSRSYICTTFYLLQLPLCLICLTSLMQVH